MDKKKGIEAACIRQGERLQVAQGAGSLTSKSIISAVADDCGCSANQVLPADRCYNRTNNGIRKPDGRLWHNRRLFLYLGWDQYRYVGPNYSYTGYVFHQPHGDVERVVARCVNSEVVEQLEVMPADSTDNEIVNRDANLVLAPWNDDEEFEDGFLEGGELWRLHRSFERSQLLAQAKKQQALNSGDKLICIVCGFDFFHTYGEVGKDFIECHHLLPLAQLRKERQTKLSDVVLVCSNCHRMLHRKRPWIYTPVELRALVANRH